MKWGHRERRVRVYAMKLHLLLVYRGSFPSKPPPRLADSTQHPAHKDTSERKKKHSRHNLIHFTTTISHSAYRRGFGSTSPDDNGKSASNANQTKLLQTHESGATANKRQNQSGVAHRALQPVYGRRKDEERINMSGELHDWTQVRRWKKTCKKGNVEMQQKSHPDDARGRRL